MIFEVFSCDMSDWSSRQLVFENKPLYTVTQTQNFVELLALSCGQYAQVCFFVTEMLMAIYCHQHHVNNMDLDFLVQVC